MSDQKRNQKMPARGELQGPVISRNFTRPRKWTITVTRGSATREAQVLANNVAVVAAVLSTAMKRSGGS